MTENVLEWVRWAAFDHLRTGRPAIVADLAAEVGFAVDTVEEALVQQCGRPIGRVCTVSEIAALSPTWWSRNPDSCTPGVGQVPPW